MLVAATLLAIPSRRIRALALGDQAALRDWIANESATRLAEARRDARLAMQRIDRAGARVLVLGEPDYPHALSDLTDPPPFLVVLGTLPAAPPGGRGTAIVGTREPSAASAAFAERLARGAGGPIVSGLALGIDAAAHRGALAAGVPTVAYVGNGVGTTYPPEHAALADEILARGGAIASERLPGEPVTRWSLLRRDRLQAAHARTVVLVESEADGGAMQTLRVARDLGRTRFVRTNDDPASGNASVLRDGARELSPNIEDALLLLTMKDGPRT